jgi:UDP-N-acetylmuramoyl-L-alanyl-D-glutamate--2,6-diaminopimelate ligase
MLAKNKIWTVFGCGGDRDKGKRPLMAQVACRLSDEVMITSDNPRTEEPEQIVSDIFVGVEIIDRERVHRQVDRKKAIAEVIRQAKMGDVILIAGKGHEEYQIVGQERLPFSDFQVAKEILV